MKDPEILVTREPRPPWSYPKRRAAAVVWAGFIGAVLATMALLIGWDAFMVAGERPGFRLLAACFAVAWLICLVSAGVAWSLSRRPSARAAP